MWASCCDPKPLANIEKFRNKRGPNVQEVLGPCEERTRSFLQSPKTISGRGVWDSTCESDYTRLASSKLRLTTTTPIYCSIL